MHFERGKQEVTMFVGTAFIHTVSNLYNITYLHGTEYVPNIYNLMFITHIMIYTFF